MYSLRYSDRLMRSTAQTIQKFCTDKQGATAAMWALVTPVLLVFAGMAVEMGLWYMGKRSLQTAADAAAYTAGLELYAGNTASYAAKAQAEAVRNNWSAANGTFTINKPPSSGSYTGDSNAVEVVLTKQAPTMFSALLSTFSGAAVSSAVTLRTRSVATQVATASNESACILALKTTADAVEITGSATVNMPNCWIFSNSTDATEAVDIAGNANVTAQSIGAVGAISVTGSATVNSTPKKPGRSAITDPYRAAGSHPVGVPTYSGCDQNNEYRLNPGNTATITPASSTTPYVFCGGLDIKGTLNLGAGVYIVKGGDFKANSQATISGSNVNIILTQSSGSYAKIDINGGAVLNLSAPTSRTVSGFDLSGVLFYVDRDAPDMDHKTNGNSTAVLNGAIYAPSGEVEFTGNSTSGNAACTQIVANEVKFGGNSTLSNNCSTAGAATIAMTSTNVRLVE